MMNVLLKNWKLFGSAGIMIAGIVFFFMWRAEVKDNEILENKYEFQSIDLSSTKFELVAVKDLVNKIQESKTQTEEYFQEREGHMEKVYNDKFSQQEKKYLKLIADKPDSIIAENTTLYTKRKIDSLTKPDLTLKYAIEYVGRINKVTFDYKVRFKTIIKNNIVFEPYETIKTKYVERSLYMLQYSYGLTNTYKIHRVNFTYLTRSGFGVNFGTIVIDSEFIPEVGLSYRF